MPNQVPEPRRIVDYVDNELLDVSGYVNKITAAIMLSPAKKFMSRPELRMYATFASWSDDFIGLTGTGPKDSSYTTEDEGWNVGLQIEHIW